MSRVLLYECFSGIAGDMNLGALIDLGVPESHVREELSKLGLNAEFTLNVSSGKKSGIAGTQAIVECVQTGSHRHLPTIRSIIDSSSLDESTKQLSIETFTRLAQAEAHIHGIGIDEVHFHEVGATDAIVDIVGAAICLEYLNPERIYSTAVELGSGMVKCEHGLMPVPAPATAELLKDRPTTRGRIRGEATTPTGAAILATHVDSFDAIPEVRIENIGYGLGQKDFEIPNVLRVSLAETENQLASVSNVEIACNIDDMSAEAFEPLFDKLFGLGALDVFLSPIVMKKSRPGTRLSVLAKPPDLQVILDAIFHGSTTLGVRIHEVTKRVLPREFLRVPTSFGNVEVKVSTLPGGSERWKTEHDDIKRLALETGKSYPETKESVDSEVRIWFESRT